MKIEPPTETDIAMYSVVASRQKARFDVLQFQDNDYEYKQVLAIFSLRRSKQDGLYKNRNKKVVKTFLDTFLVCADMECIPSIGVQRLTPYPMYRLAKGLTQEMHTTFLFLTFFFFFQHMAFLGCQFKTLTLLTHHHASFKLISTVIKRIRLLLRIT